MTRVMVPVQNQLLFLALFSAHVDTNGSHWCVQKRNNRFHLWRGSRDRSADAGTTKRGKQILLEGSSPSGRGEE